MTCEHCETARTKHWHGGYRTGCTGCAARSIARSLAMFNAVTQRRQEDFDALRETITRVMPGQPYEAARATVIEWWKNDHTRGKA